MNSTQRLFFATGVMTSILLLGILISSTLDSDFVKLEVKTVSIAYHKTALSGLLYLPSSASATDICPAIVLAHGIGGWLD